MPNLTYDKMGNKETITLPEGATAEDVKNFLEKRDPAVDDLDIRIEGDELEDVPGDTPLKEGQTIRAVPKRVSQGS